MPQRQSQGEMPAAPLLSVVDQEQWLHSITLGREALRKLLEQWFKRNGWSLAVVSRLTELSLLAQSKVPVPDWSAGMPLHPGGWVNHRGHLWQCEGTPLSEPAEGVKGWSDRGLTSRLHSSGLNLFIRNRRPLLSVTFLLELGRLNEWVAAVKAGKAAPPADQRLNQLVQAATVIRDADGPLGPEELLSIAGNRVPPPPWPDTPSTTDAGGSVSARQLRAAAAAAGLDIIEDWDKIAELYGIDDQVRLVRLQKVLQGLARWTDQQEDDEHNACLVLLNRLEKLRATANPEAPAALPPVVVKDLSADGN